MAIFRNIILLACIATASTADAQAYEHQWQQDMATANQDQIQQQNDRVQQQMVDMQRQQQEQQAQQAAQALKQYQANQPAYGSYR